MITIDQLLESVDLDFEPRFVTRDTFGSVVLWTEKPMADKESGVWNCCTSETRLYFNLKLSEFDGKDWTECIYEVSRNTTGKIEKLDIIKDTRNVIDKDGIVHTVANFTTVEKINELVDAVNELKGAKNE